MVFGNVLKQTRKQWDGSSADSSFPVFCFSRIREKKGAMCVLVPGPHYGDLQSWRKLTAKWQIAGRHLKFGRRKVKLVYSEYRCENAQNSAQNIAQNVAQNIAIRMYSICLVFIFTQNIAIYSKHAFNVCLLRILLYSLYMPSIYVYSEYCCIFYTCLVLYVYSEHCYEGHYTVIICHSLFLSTCLSRLSISLYQYIYYICPSISYILHTQPVQYFCHDAISKDGDLAQYIYIILCRAGFQG
jgi:hypothetical protein